MLDVKKIARQVAGDPAVESVSVHPDDWSELMEHHQSIGEPPPHYSEVSGLARQALGLERTADCVGMIHGKLVRVDAQQKRGTHKVSKD